MSDISIDEDILFLNCPSTKIEQSIGNTFLKHWLRLSEIWFGWIDEFDRIIFEYTRILQWNTVQLVEPLAKIEFLNDNSTFKTKSRGYSFVIANKVLELNEGTSMESFEFELDNIHHHDEEWKPYLYIGLFFNLFQSAKKKKRGGKDRNNDGYTYFP
ncbi:hypothetical protein RFI_07465 [Reticulomyxa filosa]|uniref:Uncharacterized protein n=1 Tax=Reticulomyxa filosa TaxID=46433 RepID=X6NUE2_RETFI|nr:hypothetical protein RFI_07465 [Reticulomyxa filosa]|eukprot:ETO29656.1 hypothetical protein RFI_07465 [Reticulomyxa filosa]